MATAGTEETVVKSVDTEVKEPEDVVKSVPKESLETPKDSGVELEEENKQVVASGGGDGDVVGDDDNKIQEKEEKPLPDIQEILQKAFQNRVFVAKNHPLSFYTDRAKRILRLEDTLFVKGRGSTISMACTLVEILKRAQIAKVEKVSTGMDTQAFFYIIW